ncbi:M1 family aminopeptidase [Acidobacteriota bacterium]
MNYKKSIIFVLIIFSAFVSGCDTTTQTSESPSYFVPKNPPSAQYTLEAECTMAENSIVVNGSGTIQFSHFSRRPLSAIALEWRGKSKDSLVVCFEGEKLEKMYPDSLNPILHFYSLPQAVNMNENVTLDIRYSNGYQIRDNGEISLQVWYPKLWWDGLPTRDSFRVKFDEPDGYVTASSGRQNKKTGAYESPGVTTRFAFWLSKNVQVEEQESAGVMIRVLFTEKGKECALLCLETAADVIKYFKDFHGVFPSDSLTIIPGASRPMGGYPYASGLVVIHGQEAFSDVPELHWKWITAHEIGHQYWGEYVMSDENPDDYTESWLMIGMGIMADRMWVEENGLEDDKHSSFFNRFLDGQKNYFDTTADAPESLKVQQEYDRNNVLIHGKGYSIVSALRSVLGNNQFLKTYLRCVDEFAGKRMNYRDLWAIAEEESGENLKWFFEQWVRSSKYLCYQITSTNSRSEGKDFITEITVEPCGETILMPMDLKATFKDGSSQFARIDRYSSLSKTVFRSSSEIVEATLDPLSQLAILEKPLPILPKELPSKVRNLSYNGNWDEGIDLYKLAIESDAQDYQIWFKLGMVIFEGGYLDESFTCFERILDQNAPSDYIFMAKTWFGNIRDAQGKRDEAIKLYKIALEGAPNDSGWRHDQFGIQSSREWIESRLKTPFDWITIIKK